MKPCKFRNSYETDDFVHELESHNEMGHCAGLQRPEYITSSPIKLPIKPVCFSTLKLFEKLRKKQAMWANWFNRTKSWKHFSYLTTLLGTVSRLWQEAVNCRCRHCQQSPSHLSTMPQPHTELNQLCCQDPGTSPSMTDIKITPAIQPASSNSKTSPGILPGVIK